jgi:hypothetical protein
VLTVPECAEFERINKWTADKIDKAVNYLRWKKDKFKLTKNNNISGVAVDELFGDTKVKFGIQVKLNSFLIWKYTVRWNLYPEVALLSGKVILGYLRSRKKRRRLEILFSLLQNPILNNRFEWDKLYLINQDNLKRLLQFIRKKRRRLKEEIVSREREKNLFKEEVGRNWKNRRKKHPDKVIMMDFEIVSGKEYNLLRRKMKMNKQSIRRNGFYEKRKEQLNMHNHMQKCACQNGSSNSYDVYYDADKKLKEMQQYRNIVGSIDQFDNLVKSEVDTLCLGRVLNLLWPCTEGESGD